MISVVGLTGGRASVLLLAHTSRTKTMHMAEHDLKLGILIFIYGALHAANCFNGGELTAGEFKLREIFGIYR